MALSTKARKRLQQSLAAKAQADEICNAIDAAITTVPSSSPVTTATMTLWVDAAAGSDTTGDGTSSLPYASIGKAMSSIPMFVRHACTINVKAGTYAETVYD